MTEVKNPGRYDLEARTQKFAKAVIQFISILAKTIPNEEISRQVIRSAGSVGANYIEANEALSKKDFAMRVKICRKEAKESRYWLELFDIKDEQIEKQRQLLFNEATELTKIFGAIVEKVDKS